MQDVGVPEAFLRDVAGSGLISLRVAKTYPIEKIAQAHQDLTTGGPRGRIILVP